MRNYLQQVQNPDKNEMIKIWDFEQNTTTYVPTETLSLYELEKSLLRRHGFIECWRKNKEMMLEQQYPYNWHANLLKKVGLKNKFVFL